MKSLSRVQLFATPWTVAYQAPLSMGFPRQDYWSGLPFPSPGDLPGLNPGLPHCRLMLYCLSHQGSPNLIGVSPSLIGEEALWARKANLHRKLKVQSSEKKVLSLAIWSDP